MVDVPFKGHWFYSWSPFWAFRLRTPAVEACVKQCHDWGLQTAVLRGLYQKKLQVGLSLILAGGFMAVVRSPWLFKNYVSMRQ